MQGKQCGRVKTAVTVLVPASLECGRPGGGLSLPCSRHPAPCPLWWWAPPGLGLDRLGADVPTRRGYVRGMLKSRISTLQCCAFCSSSNTSSPRCREMWVVGCVVGGLCGRQSCVGAMLSKRSLSSGGELRPVGRGPMSHAVLCLRLCTDACRV